MFSILNYDISLTTAGLISFSTLYFIYRIYMNSLESNDIYQIRNSVTSILEKIENDPLNNFHIQTKILNNKIKIFAYTKLLKKSLQ